MCAKVEENASMISITQLNEKKRFIVPTYQRGLRWSKDEVKTLLNDLYEFSLQPESRVYCLQSIVVRKISESEYEVIDGQQRLTILWLISIINFVQNRGIKERSVLDYKIEFCNKKEYNALILELIDQSNATVEIQGQKIPLGFNPEFITSLKSKYKTYDSKNMIELCDYILNGYSRKDANGEDIKSAKIIEKIFSDSLNPDKDKDIKVIFDIMSAVSNEEDSAVIDKFSKLNSGKIGLTESELIKAYIMQGADDDKAIAHQWEEIEKSLCNDKFWYMFSDVNSKNNRMDKLFEIWYCTKSGNKYEDLKKRNHVLSNAAVAYIKDDSTDNNTADKPANKLWKKIVEIHDTLFDWFNDFKLYHLIGLYLEMKSEDKSVEIISKLFSNYSQKPRDIFIQSLIHNEDDSIESLFTKIISKNKFVEKTGGNNKDGGLVPFSYESGEEKKKLRTILLLYNIALYYNANEINTANHYDRFPFDFYKNKKNRIEVEHINPQHPDWDNKVKIESEDGLSILEVYDRKNYLADYNLDENMSKSSYSKEWKQLESDGRIHSLGNLVLLDQKINDTYSNSRFKEKRRHILAALYGLPISEKNSSSKSDEIVEMEKENLKYYRNSAIFPGTRQVFLREFSGEQKELDHWSKENMETYEHYIQNTICTFFDWEINK